VIFQHLAKAGRLHASGPIPPGMEMKVKRFAVELAADYGEDFARDPTLRNRVSAMLRRSLPPRPRRPGRPGFANVTTAIRLHSEVTRSCPELTDKQAWRRIYPAVIPDWDSLSPVERREAGARLRERVRWRKRAAERRARQKRSGGKRKRELSPL
jgi:hypothetical protein